MNNYSYPFSQLKTTEEEKVGTDSLNVGFVSRLTVWWMNSLMKKGSERPLEEEDLFAVADLGSSKIIAEKLQRTWSDELKVKSIGKTDKKPSLLRAIYRIGNTCELSTIIFLPLVSCSMMLLRAIFLAMILQDLTEFGIKAIPWLYWYITGIFFFTVVEFLGENVVKYKARCAGIQARSALASLIYNKVSDNSSL